MMLDILKKGPIVPVYYNDDVELCKKVLSQCYEGGVRVFEFVNRGQHAKKNFEELLAFKNEFYSDLILGIGTIKNELQAEEFIAAGAEFLVSPIINPAIAEVAKSHNVLWIPGCMTPSEIAFAEELGSSLVKLFPGDVLGANFVKAIKPLFPSLKFMITGGVSLSPENLKTWFSSGAFAVGIGSKLFEGEFVQGDKNIVSNLKEALSFLQ